MQPFSHDFAINQGPSVPGRKQGKVVRQKPEWENRKSITYSRWVAGFQLQNYKITQLLNGAHA
jgi:hypothetical protein